MNYTTNYELRLPEGTDYVDVDDLNHNFEEIDTQMKANADGIADIIPIPTGGTEGQVLVSNGDDTVSWEDPSGGELPQGGTTGQLLTKTADGCAWQNAPKELPSGGSNGQVLKTTGSSVYWGNESGGGGVPSGGSSGQVLTNTGSNTYDWANVPTELPSGGSTGQVLTKQNGGGVAWAGVPTELPSGGSNGQVLKTTGSSVYWGNESGGGDLPTPTSSDIGKVLMVDAELDPYWDTMNGVPSSGTTGHVLTKTNNGYTWQAVPTELPSGGSTGQVLTKTADGCAWQSSSGGTKKYLHNIDFIGRNADNQPILYASFSVISTSSSEIQNLSGVASVLDGYTGYGGVNIPCNGAVNTGGTGFKHLASIGGSGGIYYFYAVSDGGSTNVAISNVASFSQSYYSSVLTDTIIALN